MKNNYSQIQDFLNDDSFVRFVLFGEDEEKWRQYRMVDSKRTAIFDQAKKLIEEIRFAEVSNSDELDSKKVWQKIKVTIGENYQNNDKKVILWDKLIFRIAASIAILFLVGYFVYNGKSTDKLSYQMLVSNLESNEIQIEKINNESTPLNIKLEDGTVITLEKNSKLSYPSHFQKDKRMVILEGEAFFEIAKNPSKPFYVYSNEIVTKVLGTSFRIKATENGKDIVVNVVSGKVSVFNQRKINFNDPENSAIILLPNQQGTFNRESKQISKQLTEIPLPVKENKDLIFPIEFDDVSVNQVLETLQKVYKVKIIYNEDDLSNCIITTKLNNESLYDQLDLICQVIGGSYKEIDAQIVLESKGCK